MRRRIGLGLLAAAMLACGLAGCEKPKPSPEPTTRFATALGAVLHARP